MNSSSRLPISRAGSEDRTRAKAQAESCKTLRPLPLGLWAGLELERASERDDRRPDGRPLCLSSVLIACQWPDASQPGGRVRALAQPDCNKQTQPAGQRVELG